MAAHQEDYRVTDSLTQNFSISQFSSSHKSDRQDIEVDKSVDLSIDKSMALGDLDIEEQMLMSSVIMKIKKTNPEQKFIEQLTEISLLLTPEEQQKLSDIVDKMEENKIKDPLQQLKRINKTPHPSAQNLTVLTEEITIRQYKDKLQKKNEEIQEMNRTIMNLEAENLELKETINRKQEISELNYDSLKRELDVRMISEEWEVEKRDLEDHFQKELARRDELVEGIRVDHETQLIKHKKTIEALQSQTTQLKFQSTALEIKNKEIEFDYEKIRSQIQTKNSEVFQVTMEFSKEKEEQENKTVFLEKQLLRTKSEVEEKASVLSELNDKFSQLSLFYTKLEAELLQEKTKNSKLNEILTEVQNKALEEKAKYEQDLQQEKTKNEKLDEKQLQMSFDLDNARAELMTLKEQFQEKDNMIQEMKFQLQKLKQIPTLMTKIERYESRLKQGAQQHAQLISKKNQTDTQLQNLKYHLQKQQVPIEKTRQKYEKKLKDLENKGKKQIQKYVQKLKKKQEEINNIIIQYQKVNQQLAESNHQSSVIIEQNQRLNGQIEELWEEKKIIFQQSVILQENKEIYQAEIENLMKSQIDLKESFIKKIEGKDKEIETLGKDSLLFISNVAQSYNGVSKIKIYEDFFKRLRNVFKKLREDEMNIFKQRVMLCLCCI